MNTTSTEVKVLKPSDSIRAMRPEFANLLKATGTDIDRFQNNAIMAINNNDDIRKGEVSSKSIFNVCSRAANDGVMLDGREAALVIGWSSKNGKEAQYRLMSGGIMKIINRSPDIDYIACQNVHENDICEISFVSEGVPVMHKPDLKKGRGEIIGTYVVARLKTGEWTSPEYMSLEEILEIRDKFASKDSKGQFSKMWRDALGEACKKTVLHRAIKRLPVGDVSSALALDEEDVSLQDVTPGAEAEQPTTEAKKRGRRSAAEKAKEAVANMPDIIDQQPEPKQEDEGQQEIMEDEDLPI